MTPVEQQQRAVEPEEPGRAENYWRQLLAGFTTPTPLGLDRPAAGDAERDAARGLACLELSPAQTAAIAAFARENRLDFSTCVEGAWALLLSRYSGEDDVVFGAAAANGAEPLPVRVHAPADAGLLPWLEELSKQRGESAAHSPVSLFEAQTWSAVPRGLPLFESVVEIGGSFEPAPWRLALSAAQFPVVRLQMSYERRRFDASVVERMLAHLRIVLTGMAAAAKDRRISGLPLLTGPEESPSLAEWNRTETGYPRDLCIHQLFEGWAARTPEAIAAIYGAREWTYRELNARANRLAHYLRKRGVGPEVPVGIYMRRSLELAVALLGVLKAGGACLPLDPDYPMERLALMQTDAQIPVLLTDAAAPGDLASSGAEVISCDLRASEIAAESAENPGAGAAPDNLAYVIYTSGSTGRPRGVLLPHRGLMNYIAAAGRLYGLSPADKVLQFSSISFDISFEEMFPTWSAGGAVVFRTEEVSLQPAAFLSWIGQQGITVLELPTAFWHALVQELSESPEPLPDSLRVVVVGGEKASRPAFAAWRKLARERVRWINTYGPTETSVIATAYEPAPGAPLPVGELPIGRPIANTRIYILDDRLRPTPFGVTGELHIAGAGLARGYLNRPEMTAAKFIADPFVSEPGARMYKTGDLARFLPDGGIEFCGRTDHQIKIRGFRVEPGEIEAALAEYPGVREALVVQRENQAGDKRLVAYVVAGFPEAPAEAGLRNFLKEKLPAYLIPAAFVPLAALPLTPNGKVDRRALPEPPPPQVADEDTPRSDAERQLVKIWESVLGIQPIGIRHNFFELGGHSLLALRLMQRVEQAFGKKLPPAALFQAPDIERLAVIVAGDGWSHRWNSLVPIQPRGGRAPLFCVHGLGGHVLRLGALARYLGPDQPFYGLQAQGLDGERPPHSRVEDMAAHYLAEVRALQPRGPYFLSGYSFGGAVAFEMARQLRAQGQLVAFVGLLDTYPGAVQSRAALAGTFLQLSGREKLAYALGKALNLPSKLRQKVSALWFPPALKRVRHCCQVAENAYSWPSYQGRVCLFHAVEKGLRGQDTASSGERTRSGENWEVYEVSTDHGGILLEPKVRELAKKMTACMERARSQALAKAV